MKVQATRQGYYGEKLRQVGEIFEIKGDKDFSENWMEKSDASDEEAAASIGHFKPAKNQGPVDPRDVHAVVKEVLGDESIAAKGGVDGRLPPAGYKAKSKKAAESAPDFDLKHASRPMEAHEAEAKEAAEASKAKDADVI